MAFMNMYPIGEEAMDLRFAAIDARLASGIGVVQMKRGITAKIKSMFNREFWATPMSTRALGKKLIAAFKSMGMEMKDDG